MKKYLNSITIAGIISMIIFCIIHLNNDYMQFKMRKCTVVDMLKTNGTGKSSGRFYLVLKEERGILFDIIVSPTTYSQSKIGNTKLFDLRQMDIKQTPFENLIYFIGGVIFGSVGFVCIIGGLTLGLIS
jgi:hypothetical protein